MSIKKNPVESDYLTSNKPSEKDIFKNRYDYNLQNEDLMITNNFVDSISLKRSYFLGDTKSLDEDTLKELIK